MGPRAVSPDVPGRAVRAGRTIEWDAAADDYGANRAPFPDLLVDLLQPLGVGVAGRRLADIGSGVGTPALQFARRGARVTAVDPAEAMLAVAVERAGHEGLDLATVVATAEATGLEPASHDSATVGQAWHWFDATAAVAEIRRILVPGGRLAICAFDWVVGADPLVDATFDVVRRHNPEVAAANPMEAVSRIDQWAAVTAEGGMTAVGSFEIALAADYTPDTWRGRLRASTWVNATLAEQAVAEVDAELRDVLADAPARLAIAHMLRAWVCESPGPPIPDRARQRAQGEGTP